MDRVIYIAMSGAKHTLEQQAAVAHNLANAATNGFRAALHAFRAAPVIGDSATQPTRAFVVASDAGTDFRAGAMQATGRSLDVVVQGKGWIAVRDASGREAYTRDGSLEVGANGILQTRTGYAVVGDGGTIAIPPNNSIAIGSDATVSLVPTDTTPNSVSTAGRIKLVNPPESALVRGEHGLFRMRDGRPAPADADLGLTSGALEGSNVNVVNAMVELISHARQFDMQVRVMRTAEDAAREWSQVMNIA